MTDLGHVLVLAGAPGMTGTSTLPMALEAAGFSFGSVCRELLLLAVRRGS